MPDEKPNRRKRAYDVARRPVSLVSIAAILVAVIFGVVHALTSPACQKNLTAPVSIEFVEKSLDTHIKGYNVHVEDFKKHIEGTDKKLEEQRKLVHKIDKQVIAIAVTVNAPIVPSEDIE